jgi:hypothetical protein
MNQHRSESRSLFPPVQGLIRELIGGLLRSERTATATALLAFHRHDPCSDRDMAPDRDDPVTREDRLADLMEEFRASQHAVARVVTRDRAAAVRAQDAADGSSPSGRQTPETADLSHRLERLATLAKRLEIDCADSADGRRTLEAILREIDTLREKLKVLNLP